MPAHDPSGENLTDDDLQSEIELVGDLVVAATSSTGPLTQEQIDQLLGVTDPADEAGSDGRSRGLRRLATHRRKRPRLARSPVATRRQSRWTPGCVAASIWL